MENNDVFNQLDIPDTEIKTETNNSNKFCIISVCLHYGAPILMGMFMALWMRVVNQNQAIYNVFGSISSLAEAGAYIASVVLMIIVRVKDRKNLFGKILMWVYIAEAILSVILGILLIVACFSLAQKCGA